MLTAAVILGLGAGGAAAAGGVAGGFLLYKKQQKKSKINKQGKSLKKEENKHEEFQEKSIEELEAIIRKGKSKYASYELGLKTDDPSASEQYMRQASSQGHILAAFELGTRFLSGEYQPQSEDMALDYFICAADRGHEEAMLAAGDIFYSREKWKEAKKYYKRCTELGNEIALNKFALTKLQTAEGDLQCQYAKSVEETDLEASIKWYTKAADQDHPESAYRLGNMYLKGNEFVEANEDKAMMLLLQASGNGHTPASLLLVEEYEKKGMFEEALQKIKLCGKSAEVKQKTEELEQKLAS